MHIFQKLLLDIFNILFVNLGYVYNFYLTYVVDAAGSVDKMDEFMLPVTRACLKECWLASVFVVFQYSQQGWLCVMETSWQIWPIVASVRNPSILNSFCRSWIAGKSSMTTSCLLWVSGPLVLSFITSLQRTRLLSLFDWNHHTTQGMI